MPDSLKTVSSLPGNRYHELVLQNVSEIIVITDLDFTVQSWNGAAAKFYGIPAAEAIGRRISELVAIDYYSTSQEEAWSSLQERRSWRGKVGFRSREGAYFYFLHTVRYITDNDGVDVGIMALGHDITEQHKAEEQLLRSEEFYRALIADSLDLTLLLNASGAIMFASPSIRRILGYTEEEVLQTSAFQYIHPEDLGWALQSFEREVEENPEIKFIVVRVLKKSGEWLWCMVRGHNLLSNPAINAIAVYIHDDTPRKKATDALKESERRFRNLIKDLQTGVLLQNAGGETVLTNEAMCRLFEATEDVLIGQRMWELFPDAVHEDGRQFLASERPTPKALRTKTVVRDVVMGVWHAGRMERIWVMVNADPLLDDAGNVLQVVCSFMDITERKKLEKKSFIEKIFHQRQLTQATIDGQEKERLETGKELHDNIGQRLTTVKLFLELASSTADDKTREFLDRAVDNVAEVINEVRFISRSLVPPTLKDLGLIEALDDLVDSLRTAQGLHINLDCAGFDEKCLPENKQLAIYRMVQEQMNNIAKHAKASQVTIVLRQTESDVLLEIEDNGIGFDSNRIKRGLGITNIHNRAELFGGKVVFSSSPGEGCSVNIRLPHAAGLITFE